MPASLLRSSFRRWFWPLAIAALIFAASSRARVASPSKIPHVDKIAHFMVYGLLGTLIVRTQRMGTAAAVWSLVAASAYGVSDEWHQSFVPGRTTQLADWIADTAGAALAITLYSKWTWYRTRLERPLWRGRGGEASAPTPKTHAASTTE